MIPAWLHALALLFLAVGFASAALVAAFELRSPQAMWIMNIVWPVVALFAGPVAVWAYLTYGVLGSARAAEDARKMGQDPPNKTQTPFPLMVAKGAAHCGAGCTLGDIIAEWAAFLAPGLAVAFGWGAVFAEKTYAVWVLDYILAFGLGVAFQYFTIAPMRGLSFGAGLWAALKADTLSLSAWQVGMYGFMAFAKFYLFRQILGGELEVNTPEFWFAMQIAMWCGFATSYPVNWWLIRAGLKEKM